MRTRQFKAPDYFVEAARQIEEIRAQFAEVLGVDERALDHLHNETITERAKERNVTKELLDLQHQSRLIDDYRWARFRHEKRSATYIEELQRLVYDPETKIIRTKVTMGDKIKQAISRLEKIFADDAKVTVKGGGYDD